MNGALTSFSSTWDLGSALTPPSFTLILLDVSTVHTRREYAHMQHHREGRHVSTLQTRRTSEGVAEQVTAQLLERAWMRMDT
ncbi:hypothetical protein M405DRAFT_821358 [Rhizopogon salebrosus TDB-379]|nr:hypothetical protein M405DRAFT_821358 [Rhizopogon salebrosus TDB-379]